jgi:pyruvate dehydrogenase E2 component (dihydrolipoamide acetyltransferase)
MSAVNMPKLSDTMEEGTVLEWRKKNGEPVRKGEVLAEIESDKASFEIEAEAEGTLHIVVEQGQPVPVGQLIAQIGGEAPAAAPRPPETQKPAAQAKPVDEGEPGAEPEPVAEAEPAAKAEPGPQAGEAAPPSMAEREGFKASPIARRLARELGVELGGLRGSGPEGRIVKDDVLAASPSGGRRREATAPSAVPSGPEVEIEEPTRMQATIARRMTQSKTTVPHFYATVEVRVDDAERTRTQLRELVPEADRVTMTDLLTRACALALRRFPEVNASWVDGHIERKRSVNIGLAVAPAQGMGLLVPVIHDADRKDLVQLSIEARQVIERARSGRPGDGDLSGGTFSISNLGMYGVDEFSAIINPPESAILAVGAIREAAVVEGGQVKVARVMRMTLSVDHRVFYGATAAQFLAEVKRLLENPVSLLLP